MEDNPMTLDYASLVDICSGGFLATLPEEKPLEYTNLAKVCGGYTTTPEGVSELNSENYKDVLERIQKI